MISGCVDTLSDSSLRHQSARLLLYERTTCCALHLRMARYPQEYPFHVAIDYGDALPESDAGYSGTSVFADARQRAQLRCCTRQHTGALARKKLCGLVQHPCTPVITQARPAREHLRLRRKGQRKHGRKLPQKAFIVLNDCADPRLLQHHLGEPGPVRIADSTPGQLPRMAAIPAHQLATEQGSVQLLSPRSGAPPQIVVCALCLEGGNHPCKSISSSSTRYYTDCDEEVKDRRLPHAGETLGEEGQKRFSKTRHANRRCSVAANTRRRRLQQGVAPGISRQ